jgi:FAD dependent oxidoreductase TIGR03364
MSQNATGVAVAGAGILGLAHAYHLARSGQRVTVFDRSPQPSGASIRNFGMIWPVGQATGLPHQTALRSLELWRELLHSARIPHFANGSLHAVYRQEEEAVAREFAELGPGHGYTVEWLSAAQMLARSPILEPQGLLGGLWSPLEIVVDPRQAIPAIVAYLSERFGVEFHFSTPVLQVETGRLDTARGSWQADRIFLCTGDDFETLFPALFAASGLVRCKLQMLRTAPQSPGFQMGPALAGGLTLRFYPAFRICPSLPNLAARVAADTPELDEWAIHILVSQTLAGEVTLGDSHQYGPAADPFNREDIDSLILRETRKLVRLPNPTIAQRWYGVYAKHPSRPWWVEDPSPGVRIVTGVGGSGMTLSLGLAEQTARA